MKITYNKNPLYTTVELDEVEKKELWYKLKIEQLEEDLFGAYFYLQEGDYFDLERARREVDPAQYEEQKLNASISERLDYYIEALQGVHVGDCTCVPCSCSKCHAEALLEIDTIPGLRKHEASKINGAFGRNNEKTIDEAIESLANYKVGSKPVGWPDNAGWECHIPRWEQEAKNAYNWLKNYRNQHFSNG